ncbi:extracellular solute-binding protein [Streptomyces sp. NPDC051940]|uniref:extracellular solute-binding protein n=1 Tax=Streptomyces sp. NPDC051940 TaxID=3155675 RepID=UPI0034179307
MKRKIIAAIGAAGLVIGLAACGSDDGGDGSDKAKAEKAPKELTVWLTVDAQNNWPELVKKADDAITAKYPGIKIKHEYYPWNDKNAKLDAVLATDKTPDVVEMGNTEMLPYMIKGAFAELDAAKFDNSAAWLGGLKESATYDGKLYGVPYYAGSRVATWRKDVAKEAGVTAAPTTYDELTGALDKIQEKNGAKFNAWYQPTRDWYAAMSYVYDNGGAIAKKDGDQWKGTLSTPEAIKGLTEFKDVVGKYMHGDLTKDEADRYIVYGQGKSAMLFGAAWEGGAAADPKVDKTGGKLKDNLESFVMPGPNGSPLPVFLGGSDLAVPAKSDAPQAASEWINAFTGKDGQQGLIGKGNLPNNTTDLAPLKEQDATKVPATAAEKSWFIPTAPGWLTLEKQNVLETMLQDICTGKKSVEDAAKWADDEINKVINTA